MVSFGNSSGALDPINVKKHIAAKVFISPDQALHTMLLKEMS